MQLFRKKPKVASETTPIDPATIEPQSADDFIKRGYAYHARREFEQAEADFRQALALNPSSSEAYYALGLNLKAQDRKEEAVRAFQQTLDRLDQMDEDAVRAHMLSRLAKGHINLLTKGNWDLRKEFWKFEG